MGLSVGEYLADHVSAICGTECFAASAIRESFGEFRKDLQVLLCCLFRNKQYEQERNRLAVWRVEWNRCGKTQKCTHGFLQPFDAAVRNGDTLAEAGRAEFFASEKTVEYCAAGDALIVLEKQADSLENALLAARIKIKDDVFGG